MYFSPFLLVCLVNASSKNMWATKDTIRHIYNNKIHMQRMYIVIGMSVIACFGKGRLPGTDALTHLRTYFQSCKNQDEASGSESGRIVAESDRNPFCNRKTNMYSYPRWWIHTTWNRYYTWIYHIANYVHRIRRLASQYMCLTNFYNI